MRVLPLACYTLSRAALPLAERLAARLAECPWSAPGQRSIGQCRIFAPQRFCPCGATPFDRLGEMLARTYRSHAAHIFLGAAGIAVRALAPLLGHKSQDPPSLVLDHAGRYVVSILSGHWGGGNDLTEHLARLLGATPVVTTASDCLGEQNPPPLDIHLRDAGLRILDWDRLPRFQAALLDNEKIFLHDPCAAVPAHPNLIPVRYIPAQALAPALHVSAHWRYCEPAPHILRVAVPRLYLGIGCRKNLAPDVLAAAVEEAFFRHGLEKKALAALCTVTDKMNEPALRLLANELSIPLKGFCAAELAACPVPHPSKAAGQRFGQPPFSVCEGAALLAASESTPDSVRLLLPKQKILSCLTLAVAAPQGGPRET